MKILRWCEWAEAVVKMLVEVRPGENLLILTDTVMTAYYWGKQQAEIQWSDGSPRV
jgi:hypothetical protein